MHHQHNNISYFTMKKTTANTGSERLEPISMKDRHHYLIRQAGSDEVRLVYNFMTFDWEDGTIDHDIQAKVFYEQMKWGLWGWNCGTSVVGFEQHVKIDEVLAEVSDEELEALFGVMKEAIAQATSWIDKDWMCLNHFQDAPCSCMYEQDVKYPYLTFWNNETHEQIFLWSDLLLHGDITYDLVAPEGYMGNYYEIPKHIFEKAAELHKKMSVKFLRQYQEFVFRKTGVTIPLKEYTPAEIEEEKRKLAERQEELRKILAGHL